LLPITEQQVSAAAPTANDDSGQVGEWEAFLNNVPVIPTISDHVRQIYRQGLQMGNHAHVIAKIGDCNTENYAFLSPLDSGNEDLGPYSNLQPAVEYFKGSFSLDSVAGRTGYSALTVLDSTWADPRVCQPGESSAYCEIRRRHASVAIIMFGSNDIFTLTADQYESSIRQIIEMSIAHGTIPILTTATNRRELGNKWATLLQFNVITVNLARQYDVPVINFWLAAQSLPGGGISSDLAHLTYSGSPRVSFNGEEKIAGFSLRNLVTLQALEAVRQAVAGS
jgi:lysophospholipase L1-like esterase